MPRWPGGDCIDDADALRAGGTARILGGTIKAPSTLGTFLRSFRWGHVRQLDRVSRELLARAWQSSAGPGDSPLTIDLDSTICETYGLAKEGARHHGYTGKRGYHPLLAVAAGTGDVLMCRLREGRANTARGAAHFLRETVGRVRYGGASGQLTVRADSGIAYTDSVVSSLLQAGRALLHLPSAGVHKSAEPIEAIPEADRSHRLTTRGSHCSRSVTRLRRAEIEPTHHRGVGGRREADGRLLLRGTQLLRDVLKQGGAGRSEDTLPPIPARC